MEVVEVAVEVAVEVDRVIDSVAVLSLVEILQ